MSINTIIQGLAQFLAKTPEFTPLEAELESVGQFNLKPGQQVQAEILANLPNHRTLVRIAGELLKMELPLNVQPGETLAMTFIDEEPRLTFALSRSSNSAVPVNISDTGKLLAMLAGNGARQQAEALLRMNLILDGPPGDAPLLAAKLREALTFSGLYYESHLAQWALGERTLKELFREPQGKLSARAKTADGVKSARNSPRPEAADTSGSKDKSVTDSTSTEVGRDEESFSKIASETLPIIREQMQALHTGRFDWQGEVWPDQHMEWSVGEREPETEKERGKEWETTLRLEMPVLGTVEASLKLGAEGLRLHIVTDSSSTAAAMMSGRDSLMEAMSTAGLRLAEMVIDCEQDGSGN
jgi:hypothetical protein